MSSILFEGRFAFGEQWGGVMFTGIACLYGGGLECGDSSNIYANIGGRLYYLLKPKEKIAVTLEHADGEADNEGLYLQMGWGL